MMNIIQSVITVVLTAVSGYLVWVAQQLFKTKSLTNKAVQVLMKKELRDIHDTCMRQGFITAEQLGEFEEIYKIYHEAGGNGTATVWKTDLEHLERR